MMDDPMNVKILDGWSEWRPCGGDSIVAPTKFIVDQRPTPDTKIDQPSTTVPDATVIHYPPREDEKLPPDDLAPTVMKGSYTPYLSPKLNVFAVVMLLWCVATIVYLIVFL